MRISDWSSDVCSSDLSVRPLGSSQSLCWLLQLRFARASRLLQPQARSAHPRSYTAKPLASGYGCRCSPQIVRGNSAPFGEFCRKVRHGGTFGSSAGGLRSEEHTSELQSLMRISDAVFCLKTQNKSHQLICHYIL